MKPAAKLETNVQTVKKSGANQEEEIPQNVNYNTQPHRVQKYPNELGPNNGNSQYYERPYATGQVNFYPTTNQVGYQPTNMVQAPGTAFGTVVNYPPPGSYYPGPANVPMPY